MNLVDSCGWLEYFADAPNADFFAPAIEDTANLLIPTICLLEVYRRILVQRGEEDAQKAVNAMKVGLVAPLDEDIAILAAAIGKDVKLPLADSVILATARANNAVVWTQDADFKGLDNVRFIEKL